MPPLKPRRDRDRTTRQHRVIGSCHKQREPETTVVDCAAFLAIAELPDGDARRNVAKVFENERVDIFTQ